MFKHQPHQQADCMRGTLVQTRNIVVSMSQSWPQLWVSVVGVAHLFALLCLLQAARSLRLKLFARLCRRSGVKQAKQRHVRQEAALHSRDSAAESGGTSTFHARSPCGKKTAVLAWHGVGCSYKGSGGKLKMVLQDAMGLVCTGELTGILGPSGSGKSTLLEILAGRKSVGLLTGRLGLLPNPHTATEASMGQPSPLTGDNAPAGDGDRTSVLTAAVPDSTPVGAEVQIGAGLGCEPPSPVSDSSALVPSKPSEGWKVSLVPVAAHTLVWRDVRPHAPAVKHVSSFVPQDNVFAPSMTALEVMQVQASLLGLENSSAQVAAALAAVGLASHAATLVGGPLPGGLILQGLSGGERKRLAVAAGLLGTPRLLILDEPTTGLDASSASSLMRLLASMCAQQGISVLCSLHQPRAAIWSQLHVVVVVAGGHCLYSGPREGLVPWMSHLGYIYTPLRHGSPPDWVMDLVNTSFAKSKRYFSRTMGSADDLAHAAAAFSQYWVSTHPALEQGGTPTRPAPPPAASALPLTVLARPARLKQWFSRLCRTCGAVGDGPGDAVDKQLQRSVHPECLSPAQASDSAHGSVGAFEDVRSHAGLQPSRKRASWLQQVVVLTWREAALQYRNPADLAGRALVFCWAALVVGAVFFALDYDVQGLQFRSIVCYVETCILFLLPFVYMSVYVADRRIFVSELVSGLYHPTAYYCAKSMLLVFFGALNAIIFSLIVYGMVGFTRVAEPLVGHVLLTCLGYLVAQQVLYCAALLAPNQDAAFMLAIVWTAVNILLANYPMRLVEYTMSWVSPLRYISAMYFTFSGLLSAEFRHSPTYSCAGGLGAGVVTALPRYLPNTQVVRLPVIQNLLLSPGADCVLAPQAVLDYFNVPWEWWAYALLLMAYLLAMHAASIAALLWVARKELR